VRRLARAGARFAFFPLKSGRYHIRSASRSRKPRLLPWQRETLERNWRAGRPIYEDGTAKTKAKPVRTIAFASPHCLIDFTSGAAIATLQALRFLFQGVSDEARAGKPYGQIPWRLGILERNGF
jgi:hypothetical protein